VIRTPDQRLRVFISSTLKELGEERSRARDAVNQLHLTPILFEQGARPHSPAALYRAYLDQSHVFIGIYWQQYGWVAQGMDISGLEDEYRLAADKPRLIYIREPAPERDPRLTKMLDQIKRDGRTSYKRFRSPSELGTLIEEDLALLLSERFEGPSLAGIRRAEVPARGASTVPAPPSRFIGRESEIRAVRELLERPATRLVTLTGLGGIGKTRLALKVAEDIQDRFPDGLAIVPLEDVSRDTLVMTAIAQSLGLQESANRSPRQNLEDYLRTREMLLVLDGFEHVMGAARDLAALLERCPRLKILVTSREVLHISGEQLFDVPPLPVPANSRLPTATIGASEATRLFLDRAQAAGGRLELDDVTAPIVAELVMRLEGLPLAIELAAARVRLMPPAAILQRLGSRLELLTGGPKDLPPRKRTLRNIIDWSYSLLDDGDKELLARLAVFVGGWTLDAVEAVCEPKGPNAVDGVSSLMDKSLVRSAGFAGDEPRFSMLDLVREFALERLADRGEVELRRNRHAEYFLSLAERGIPTPKGPPPEQTLERLTAESGNLRAAMRHFAARPAPNLAVRMAWALWDCWWLRSRLSESVAWMEGVLEAGDKLSPEERAEATYVLGASVFGLGDRERAISNFEISQRLFRDRGDRRGAALALAGVGTIAVEAGDLRRGEEMTREAWAVLQKMGDHFAAFEIAMFGLRYLLLAQGKFEEAIRLLEENVRWARDSGNRTLLTIGLINLGMAQIEAGRNVPAKAALLESLNLARELEDVSQVPWALDLFASLAVAVGDAKRGAVLLGAAEGGRRSQGLEIWSSEGRRRDRTRQVCLATLGEEGFASMFAEGTRMSVEDAIQLAAALP